MYLFFGRAVERSVRSLSIGGSIASALFEILLLFTRFGYTISTALIFDCIEEFMLDRYSSLNSLLVVELRTELVRLILVNALDGDLPVIGLTLNFGLS